MYLIGAIVTGVFGFVYFGMLNTGAATIIFLAIVLSLIPHDMITARRLRSSRRALPVGCATAALRWAISLLPLSPVALRR